MNKQIFKTALKDIIFIDIDMGAREEMPEPIQKVIDYKKSLDKFDNDALLYRHPLYAELKAIGLAYIKEGVCKTKLITGKQEDIINEFAEMNLSGRTLCGWNLNGYKLPWLRHKFMEQGLVKKYFSFSFNDAGKKPWDLENLTIDLMKITSGSLYAPMSFEETCALMGVGNISLNTEGYSKKHFIKRLENTVSLFMKLREDDIELEYEEVIGDISKLPLFDRLLHQDNFTEIDLEEIKELVKGLNDGERVKAKDIIGAAIVKGKAKEDRDRLRVLKKVFS